MTTLWKPTYAPALSRSTSSIYRRSAFHASSVFDFLALMTTRTMDEDSHWSAACSWVQDQVVISFRHRAIASRLGTSATENTGKAEPPERMLVIQLPPELNSEEALHVDADQGSVAQLKQTVVARLKLLEEMESIEEQVRMQKEQRRKLGKLKKISPSIGNNGNTPSRTSAKRLSS